MARNRNTIAQFVSFDMAAMATHIQGMTDAQLGAWCRKMVIDCCSGCLDPNTDPFVRSYYNRSQSKMLEKQNQNSRNYQSRIARRAAEFFENDQPIAESATRTSEAEKALADGDARAGSLNVTDGSNAAQPESGTSAKTLGEARESRRTGGTPKRVEKPTASHAETLPVRSPDLFGETPKPEKVKNAYGTNRNVMLSDADGHHLREVYGQDLSTAIEILDSALENNPKLKKRYTNHAAVLRFGNWVWQEVQKIKERQLRLETAEINKKAAEKRAANGDGRTFKQKDSDARNEWLRTSMFTNEAANG